MKEPESAQHDPGTASGLSRESGPEGESSPASLSASVAGPSRKSGTPSSGNDLTAHSIAEGIPVSESETGTIAGAGNYHAAALVKPQTVYESLSESELKRLDKKEYSRRSDRFQIFCF